MTDLERIKDYYEIYTIHSNIYLEMTKEKSGYNEPLPKGNKIIYFTFGNPMTDENKEEMIKQGKVIAISGIEFHRQYFGWTDEEVLQKTYGYGSRTLSYLESIKENLGFIEKIHTESPERYENINVKCKIELWNTEIDIGVGVESGHWYSERVEMVGDAVIFSRYIFNKKPTAKTIDTIRVISDLEFNFKFKGRKEVFNCWECGKEGHWLDLDGNLFQKIEGLEEKYCGC